MKPKGLSELTPPPVADPWAQIRNTRLTGRALIRWCLGEDSTLSDAFITLTFP